VLTGFMVSELIRVVTKITDPIATNKLRMLDFTTMETAVGETWERDPVCNVCGDTRQGVRLDDLTCTASQDRQFDAV